MALTKMQIAEMIITNKSGGVNPMYNKYDPREVWNYIEVVRNTMIDNMLLAGGDIDGEFLSVYPDVEVKCDDATGEKYSILPAKVISLTDQRGLWQISPMKNQRHIFYKSKNGSLAVHNNLEAGQRKSDTFYWLERRRVIYNNIPFKYDKVLMKLIASVENFREDELLPIPARFEAQLVDAVRNMLMEKKQTPSEKISDSSPNQ